MLLSIGSGYGADALSSQCLDQHGKDKDNLFLVLYEACVGQEMNCDHQNLVIFDERQEKGNAQYVIAEMPPWRQNAFRPGNRDMEVAHLVFDKIPSCRRNDFSLGECEPQHEHRSVKLDMLRGQKLHDLSCLAKHDLFISCVDYHKVLLLLACNGSLADRI